LLYATQSTTIIGIYIFSVYFWGSYLNTIGVIGILVGANPVILAFIGLFTIPVVFIFIGAVIGMLSGV
jgi:hypothetical protein